MIPATFPRHNVRQRFEQPPRRPRRSATASRLLGAWFTSMRLPLPGLGLALALPCAALACGGSTSITPGHDAGPLSDGPAADAPLDDGQAQPDAPTTCVLEQSSTLPHVHIAFTSTQCVFTLAQAAAGVTFTYDLVVDQDVPDFVPGKPYWYGSNAANLVLDEQVSGGGQGYCLCDQGLPLPQCPTEDGGLGMVPNSPTGPCPAVTIPAGTYHRSFHWDGRNWTGPSDTGNPEGAPFPAGDYTFEVSTAAGSVGDAGMLSALGRFRVRLVP